MSRFLLAALPLAALSAAVTAGCSHQAAETQPSVAGVSPMNPEAQQGRTAHIDLNRQMAKQRAMARLQAEQKNKGSAQ